MQKRRIIHFLIKNHWKILFPCFIIQFFTGLGQTFLLAQFMPNFIQEFSLTKTEIGFYYSIATLIAAFNLPYVGKLIDRMSIKYFTMIVLFFMGVGLLLLGPLSTNIVTLVLGFYFLRGFGQMPLGMISSTTLGRNFGVHRAKVQAISTLGRSLAEGVLPSLVILLMALWGYKMTLAFLALLLVLIILSIVVLFFPYFPSTPLYADKVGKHFKTSKITPYLRENWWWHIGIMVTGALVPMIVTGLFFHQASLLEFKLWSIKAIAASFIFFSLFQLLGNFIWGSLIDKYSAKVFLSFSLVPFFVTLVVLYFSNSSAGIFYYMGLLGFSVSLGSMLRTSLWAEIFDLKYLGRIKSIDGLVTVMGTALAPILFGKVLDLNYSFAYILLFSLLLCLLAIILNITITKVVLTKKVVSGPQL